MDERKKEDLSVQDVEVVPVKKKRKKISISISFYLREGKNYGFSNYKRKILCSTK